MSWDKRMACADAQNLWDVRRWTNGRENQARAQDLLLS